MYISGLEIILSSILIAAMLLLIIITHVMNRRLLKADRIHISEKEHMQKKIKELASVRHSNIVELIKALYMCNNELFHFNKDDLTMIIKYTNIKYRISMNNREVKFLRISNIFFKDEDTIESINNNLTDDDCEKLMMIASNVRLRSM